MLGYQAGNQILPFVGQDTTFRRWLVAKGWYDSSIQILYSVSLYHMQELLFFFETQIWNGESPGHNERLHSWTIWVQICSWRREKRWRHNWHIGHVCHWPLELLSWSWSCPLKVCSVWISGPTRELCNLRKSCPTWCGRTALWRAGKWWFKYSYNHRSTCWASKSKSRWLVIFRPPC